MAISDVALQRNQEFPLEALGIRTCSWKRLVLPGWVHNSKDQIFAHEAILLTPKRTFSMMYRGQVSRLHKKHIVLCIPSPSWSSPKFDEDLLRNIGNPSSRLTWLGASITAPRTTFCSRLESSPPHYFPPFLQVPWRGRFRIGGHDGRESSLRGIFLPVVNSYLPDCPQSSLSSHLNHKSMLVFFLGLSLRHLRVSLELFVPHWTSTLQIFSHTYAL